MVNLSNQDVIKKFFFRQVEKDYIRNSETNYCNFEWANNALNRRNDAHKNNNKKANKMSNDTPSRRKEVNLKKTINKNNDNQNVIVDYNDSIVCDIEKARKNIQLSLASSGRGKDEERIKNLEAQVEHLSKTMSEILNVLKELNIQVPTKDKSSVKPEPKKAAAAAPVADDDDDDVDLFGSDDDEEANQLRQKRLDEYAAKKAKKPAAVAKSSVVLDIKPWDDETDMKEMERLVRTVEMDGLVWGASKLVPLAYGIKKLQIVCVIEDEKVSVEELTEKLCEFEDHVQSVDVAAFNKI